MATPQKITAADAQSLVSANNTVSGYLGDALSAADIDHLVPRAAAIELLGEQAAARIKATGLKVQQINKGQRIGHESTSQPFIGVNLRQLRAYSQGESIQLGS